jgi:Domain of unknown function (DUF4180)
MNSRRRVNSTVGRLADHPNQRMDRGRKFLIAADRGISIQSRDDISDAVGASLGRGLILLENDLGSEFFDLRTGLAGELIQKFVNYRTRVAIVIAVPDGHGARFSELAYEHATHPTVRFVRSLDDAMQWMQT